MPITELKVSMECFNEIANALEAQGKKVNPEESITITKDTSIKGPVDWRLVKVKMDVLQWYKDVYQPPVDENQFLSNNNSHFIEAFDAVVDYILKGDKPDNQTKVASAKKTKTAPVKNPQSW